MCLILLLYIQMLMSIFDDLLSNERQAEWAELQLVCVASLYFIIDE